MEPAAAGPVQAETTDESRQDETAEPASLRRRHPGRRRLPADLPRERIEVIPPAGERHCTNCDTAKVRIGADITEELDYVPASFVIREYVRPKYACGRCQQRVVQAVLPARPIEKGRPGPGLLAHVVSSKYADHLPLYRLEQIFARHGVQVTRAHALGVERGSGRLTGTDRARHAPGAGAPVALDSMRRHDPGCARPESSAGDSDRASVGVSG